VLSGQLHSWCLLTLIASSLNGTLDLAGSDRIDILRLRELIAREQVIIIDVRDRSLFAMGHIPSSVNVPMVDIEQFLGEWRAFPEGERRKLVVTYCNCKGETSSLTLARALRAGGIRNVFALSGGVRAWVESGGKLVRRPTLSARK
jgi:rhodanese-related sulfurtransferase